MFSPILFLPQKLVKYKKDLHLFIYNELDGKMSKFPPDKMLNDKLDDFEVDAGKVRQQFLQAQQATASVVDSCQGQLNVSIFKSLKKA